MSVLIKGLKMPKDCPLCPCAHWNKNDVMTGCEIVWRYVPDSETDYWQSDKRPKWCPLVEVPTPHGRLIDEDVFIREINERIDAAIKWGTNAIADRENEIRLRAEQAVATFCEASLTAKKMPTIIEAEEGEEE